MHFSTYFKGLKAGSEIKRFERGNFTPAPQLPVLALAGQQRNLPRAPLTMSRGSLLSGLAPAKQQVLQVRVGEQLCNISCCGSHVDVAIMVGLNSVQVVQNSMKAKKRGENDHSPVFGGAHLHPHIPGPTHSAHSRHYLSLSVAPALTTCAPPLPSCCSC